MTAQETAYTEIERLVKSFKDMPAAQRKGLNEMQTRLGYILPLFKALGWDTSNINEVSPEEKVSRGWVDFSFRIGNVPRYFLETKRANEDLNDARWVKQSIDYAWTKSVTWALLSDFEGLRVFNAEWKESNPFSAQFFELTVDSYLTEFDRLWWLSKVETVARRLDLEAEKVGKKVKRQAVSQILFTDLKSWRTNLFKNYKAFNLGYSAAQIDEAVLRLLNRLIFIRTAEDREVEDNRLRTLVRVLKDKKQINHLDRELAALFREMDTVYNSELFARHFSEELQIPPTDLEEIIEGLYEKNFTRYNFNALDADVLGTAYEQYLGHVMAEGPDDTSTTLSVHMEEKRTKRKSQGIYYTPTFVTKYIVQQTVGKYLDEHGYSPSKPLRVLDMACGSGSFLIEAFDVIDDFVAKQRGHAQRGEVDFHDRMRQLEVLQNCIYGVDKDKQAVEVARLNLLLRGLHSREKLPMLENIAHGDSLHQENFEMNFSQVMKEGGFDVIVGNPPYVRQETLGEEFKIYAKQNFETYAGTADLYVYFIERAHKLLKPGGLFGMIVSNKWMRSNYGKALRQFLTKNAEILEIVDFGELPVFGDVLAYPVIIITRRHSTDRHNIHYAKIKNLDFESLPDEVRKVGVELKEHLFENDNWNLLATNEQGLLSKIYENSEPLGKFVENQIYRGLLTGLNDAFIVDQSTYNKIVSNDAASKKLLKPFLMGRDVHEYFSDISDRYLICIPRGYTNSIKQPKQDALLWLKKSFPGIADHLLPFEEQAKKRQDKGDYWWELRACDYYDKFALPKIIAPAIVQNATFTFDADGFYSNDKTSIVVSNDLYVLGILNSGLTDLILKQIASTKQGGYFEQKPMYISQLPIRRIDFEKLTEKLAHDEIVRLVEKMLALQKERHLVRREDDLDRVRSLERQIAQVDAEIDQRVYALYGLTEEEIRIVEGS